MSLISGMLQEEQSTWFTLAEIMEHPWLKEEAATEEEVIEEMNWRYTQITGITPDVDMPTSDPNIFEKINQAHRGMKGEGEVDIAELDFNSLRAKDFKEGVNRANVFYSTTNGDELYWILL